MLEKKLEQDYIQAMKSHDKVKSAALNFLRAQVKYAKIDKRADILEDADVVSVIKKQVKQRQDSIAQFEQGNRLDLVSKEKAELDILKDYLPAEMSMEQLNSLVDEAIKNLGATSIKDMGKIIKEVAQKSAGQADNKTISDSVKNRRSKL